MWNWMDPGFIHVGICALATGAQGYLFFYIFVSLNASRRLHLTSGSNLVVTKVNLLFMLVTTIFICQLCRFSFRVVVLTIKAINLNMNDYGMCFDSAYATLHHWGCLTATYDMDLILKMGLSLCSIPGFLGVLVKRFYEIIFLDKVTRENHNAGA